MVPTNPVLCSRWFTLSVTCENVMLVSWKPYGRRLHRGPADRCDASQLRPFFSSTRFIPPVSHMWFFVVFWEARWRRLYSGSERRGPGCGGGSEENQGRYPRHRECYFFFTFRDKARHRIRKLANMKGRPRCVGNTGNLVVVMKHAKTEVAPSQQKDLPALSRSPKTDFGKICTW